MKNVLINFLNSLVFILVSSLAYADSQSVDGLNMNGIASFQKLRKDYYIAALYLEERSNFPDYVLAMPGKKVMDIRITIDSWSMRSFNSIWTESILINNDEASQTTNKDIIMAFGKMLKTDLKKGDHLSIVFTPDTGSSIILNNTMLLSTTDDSLFNLLVNTWIGERPYSSDFKRDLLNLNNDTNTAALIKRHSEIKPDAKRVTEVISWVPKKDEPKADTKKTSSSALAGMPPSDDTSVTATGSRNMAVEKITLDEPEKPKMTVAMDKPAINTQVPKPVVAKPESVPTPAKQVTPAAPKTVAVAPANPVPTQSPAPTATPPPVTVATTPAANSPDKLLKTFRANVLKQTYRNTKYPERSINLKQEGLIVLKLTINRSGKVVNITEEQTSEFSSLNKAAEIAVKRSQPYSPPPDELPGDRFDVSVPFNFKL